MRLSIQEIKRVHNDVLSHSEVNYDCCFQCKTCANACPFLDAMDIHPNIILRMLQLGIDQPALESSTLRAAGARARHRERLRPLRRRNLAVAGVDPGRSCSPSRLRTTARSCWRFRRPTSMSGTT